MLNNEFAKRNIEDQIVKSQSISVFIVIVKRQGFFYNINFLYFHIVLMY
jgi:hypothetical protein